MFCVLAGVALAVHFGLWVPSIKLSSIATATALVATQPVWQGLLAAAQGRRPPRLTWLGIGLAVVGAIAATGADIGVSHSAVVGDVMALGAAIAAAVYTALGERARVQVSTTSYATLCYTVCALLLLAVCVASGAHLTGYTTATWLALVGLTVGPQLLGHFLFSYALRRVAATTVAVLILLEVPGAGLLGWAWLGQVPRPAAVPGLLTLVAGVVVVVLAGRRGQALVPAGSTVPAESA
jgi:drug/metabolite transporter (DMT)-like permease